MNAHPTQPSWPELTPGWEDWSACYAWSEVQACMTHSRWRPHPSRAWAGGWGMGRCAGLAGVAGRRPSPPASTGSTGGATTRGAGPPGSCCCCCWGAGTGAPLAAPSSASSASGRANRTSLLSPNRTCKGVLGKHGGKGGQSMLLLQTQLQQLNIPTQQRQTGHRRKFPPPPDRARIGLAGSPFALAPLRRRPAGPEGPHPCLLLHALRQKWAAACGPWQAGVPCPLHQSRCSPGRAAARSLGSCLHLPPGACCRPLEGSGASRRRAPAAAAVVVGAG